MIIQKALRRFVALVIIAAWTAMSITSCGGGTTTTETFEPGVSFDEQIRVINPFTLDDADKNGITGHAVIDGVKLEEGKYPIITVPNGQEEIKVSFGIDGHGFIRPGGVRETGRITDLYDTSTGKQDPLCMAKTSVGSLPDVASRLDILREEQETIRIESLRQPEDREVEVAIVLRADPNTAQRIAGRNSGIQEIPAERRTEIERVRNSPTSYLGLISLALSFMDGGAGLGVGEFACGDPNVVLHALLIIKGHGGGGGNNPGPGPTFVDGQPSVSLTGNPTSGTAPLNVTFTATAQDNDTGETGNIVLYEWDLDGNGQYETTGETIRSFVYQPGTYNVKVRVTDDEGNTKVSNTVMVTVTQGSNPGKTLDGKPYDDSKAFLILTPEATTVDESTNDYQQLWPVVAFPSPTEVLRSELWSIQSWETTAPSGALTNGGMFSAVIAGPGTYTVRANVELKTYIGSTLAPTARVAETDINVIGGHSGSRAVSYVGMPYISPTTGRWTCDIWLR